MSAEEHAERAEAAAERAGGYLSAAEAIVHPEPDQPSPIDPGAAMTLAVAYAQMASASATLSLAQRVAAQTEQSQANTEALGTALDG